MGIIKILPEQVANKIAAGEVVERPASIVKELIENSLDAGAKKIYISIGHGGKSFIRVSDDGHGMSADDAEIAFKPHATSKITSIDDLESIASYGFRGEALPSIAAVSRIKMVTRRSQDKEGTEVSIDGGSPISVKRAAASTGTTIEVRDLFFNTPARRKFLKTDATELGHVLDAVSYLSLARLDVHFVLEHQNDKILDLIAGESLLVRAAKVLGGQTSGHFVSINSEVAGLKVSGLAGKPFVARSNRSGQIFYVNKRWVKAQGLGYGLQAAYHGLLMHGQYPVAVLFLELDPARVDVNVHPTKQEVRLSNEASIKSLLKDAVRQALEKAGDFAPTLNPFAQPAGATASSTAPESSEAMKPKDWRSFFSPSSSPSEINKKLTAAEPVSAYKTQPDKEFGFTRESILLTRFGITKILGQIHQTFIIAETEEGFLLADQHAVHERIMFESLLRNLKANSPARQNLLVEEILEIHPKYEENLKESLEFLSKLGFEVEPFGEKTYVVRALPAALGNESGVRIIQTFLEELEEGNIRPSAQDYQEELAALVACKRKSVKAYDPLSIEAMTSLFEQLSYCENPFHCPHGRPAFFKQTFYDLEKQFKRK